MTKRKITPERREERKKLLELLRGAGINDVAGVQELFKEMVGTVLESGLEGELEEELGYSKYDYRNKDTDNSRNGYSEKTLKSSLGDIEISVPRDRKGEFEPQIVRKTRLLSAETSKKRYFPCTQRG
jgi:putative transposase